MYWLIKIISRFFCAIPYRIAVSIGKYGGYIFFLFSRKKKAQALKNLRLVFPRKKYRQIVAIAKKSYINFGMTLIETLRMPKEVKDIHSNRFIIENKEYLSSIQEEKGIFTGIHMGSWELCNIAVSKELPFVVIARRQRHKSFDTFLNEQRVREGLQVLYEDEIRKIVTHIKKGHILGAVFDHGTKGSDIYAPFFGKIIPVPNGVLRFAFNFKKKIYPACIRRQNKYYHRITLFKPIEVKSKKEFAEKARLLNKCFEDYLRHYPQGYLWWYKRFKRSKNLNLLILSDKKVGHVRQSLSLAHIIEKRRPSSPIEIVELNLPKIKRLFFDLCNIFSSRKCIGCLRCARFILGRDFDRVFKYADIIISCGASLSSLNRILSYGLEAKSFIIQKANTCLHKHDLVILPFHDRAPSLDNVVRINGSLSSFENQDLGEDKEKLRKISKPYQESLVKIGIFIGGPLKGTYNKNDIINFLQVLKEISLKNNWQLFLTTSRRTPFYVEGFLERYFKNICLLIIANKENFPFVSSGIIAHADVILVSSDSISMITEAAQSRSTLVFDAFAALRSNKHKNFIEDMSKRKYLATVDSKNLEETVKKIIKKEITLKKINNRGIIEEALKARL